MSDFNKILFQSNADGNVTVTSFLSDGERFGPVSLYKLAGEPFEAEVVNFLPNGFQENILVNFVFKKHEYTGKNAWFVKVVEDPAYPCPGWYGETVYKEMRTEASLEVSAPVSAVVRILAPTE